MSRCAAAPTGKRKSPAKRRGKIGAGGVTRTPDLRITSALLYRLSYTSIMKAKTLFLRISTKQTPRKRAIKGQFSTRFALRGYVEKRRKT